MNKQDLIAQIAEHKSISTTKNFEVITLGLTNTKKPVKVSAEDKRKHDILEDKKNSLTYGEEPDIFK